MATTPKKTGTAKPKAAKPIDLNGLIAEFPLSVSLNAKV